MRRSGAALLICRRVQRVQVVAIQYFTLTVEELIYLLVDKSKKRIAYLDKAFCHNRFWANKMHQQWPNAYDRAW